MVSPGSSRRVESATVPIAGLCAFRAHRLASIGWALLVAAILSLSLFASGLRINGGLAFGGAALRDCVGGDQAHNYDGPGQPPPRLLDAELRNDGHDDDDDDGDAPVDFVVDPAVRVSSISSPFELDPRRSAAAQRACEGQGARAPPLA